MFEWFHIQEKKKKYINNSTNPNSIENFQQYQRLMTFISKNQHEL